jgi:hypothetical protein
MDIADRKMMSRPFAAKRFSCILPRKQESRSKQSERKNGLPRRSNR